MRTTANHKEKRQAGAPVNIDDMRAAMTREGDLSLACPIFQLFGSDSRCAGSSKCKEHRCTVCSSTAHGAMENEPCEAFLRGKLKSVALPLLLRQMRLSPPTSDQRLLHADPSVYCMLTSRSQHARSWPTVPLAYRTAPTVRLYFII